MSSGPSTPISLRYTYRPFNSSPLASPSPSRSSPLTPSFRNQNSVPERRRLQFKSQTPNSSGACSGTLSSPLSAGRQILSSRTRSSGATANLSATSSRQTGIRPQFSHAEDPQKQFLRERVKAKCLERAQNARARAVKKRRYTGYSDRSSDSFEVDDDGMNDDDDEEEDDNAIMDDELFRRIMNQSNRKADHSYRLSYALEVGSSFDPDLEDVAEWEQEIQGIPNPTPEPSVTDFDEEELDAYVEECARQAALDDLASIPEEELFHWSDIDDLLEEDPKATGDMDLS